MKVKLKDLLDFPLDFLKSMLVFDWNSSSSSSSFNFKTFFFPKSNVYYFEIEIGRIKYLFICETQYSGVNEMRMDFIVTIYLIKLFDSFVSLLLKKGI